MKMSTCTSSLINSYGYDEDSLEMNIQFQNGDTYKYRGVTKDRFLDFVRASSKGKHFLSNIKGKYEYEKL